MNVIESITDADHLLTIFAGEDISLPWRYQPYFRIRIPFDEYVKFVRLMLDTQIRPFVFDEQVYRRQLKNYEKGETMGMLKLYYVDVSQAILNEFNISVRRRADATIISTLFPECENVFELSNINEMFKNIDATVVQQVYAQVHSELKCRFTMLSQHNENMLKYAIGLRALAMSQAPVKLNIV